MIFMDQPRILRTFQEFRGATELASFKCKLARRFVQGPAARKSPNPWTDREDSLAQAIQEISRKRCNFSGGNRPLVLTTLDIGAKARGEDPQRLDTVRFFAGQPLSQR